MPSFNQIILMGHCTRDPQLKYLPSNTPVCEFGIATNHNWKDRDGNAKEEVCFVDCTAFGKTAEMINEHFAKGRAIMVIGRLKYDSWTSQEGQKRSRHTVAVERVQFVDSKPKEQSKPRQEEFAEPDDTPVPSGSDIPF